MERKIELLKVSLIMAFMMANGFLNSAFGGKLKAEDLFQSKKLLEIQIKLSPSDWEKLRKESDRRNAGFGRLFSGGRSTGTRFNLYKADITIDGANAIIRGVKRLSGAAVKITDLRAGAALVIAGLAAQGWTEVHGMQHLQRGYYQLADKIRLLGGRVSDEVGA